MLYSMFLVLCPFEMCLLCLNPLLNSLVQHFFFSLLTEVELIYNVSGVLQSDSVIYIQNLFQIPFHYRLLQDIEYSSLHYIVSLCLTILYVVVCIHSSQTPNLSFPPPSTFRLW